MVRSQTAAARRRCRNLPDSRPRRGEDVITSAEREAESGGAEEPCRVGPCRLVPHLPSPIRSVWLLTLLSPLARAAAWIYYRVRYSGELAPGTGPVLPVAHHPNSLLDPMLVVAAAGRSVRFLAKAPLFTDRRIDWLVKAARATPAARPPH